MRTNAAPVDDVERLQRQAGAVRRAAAAAFPRGLGYYVAGALFIVCAAVLFSLDSAASAKCDAATQAAESARKTPEDARTARDAALQ